MSDEVEARLSGDEIMNRVNAWQAHPALDHRICPHCERNLIYAGFNLTCLVCKFHEDIPKEMLKLSPRQLMTLSISAASMTFNNGRLVEELVKRLNNPEIVA
mgnify:FL=1